MEVDVRIKFGDEGTNQEMYSREINYQEKRRKSWLEKGRWFVVIVSSSR